MRNLPKHADLKQALDQTIRSIGPAGSWITLVAYPSGSYSLRFGDPLIVDMKCYGKERVTPTCNTTAVAALLLAAAKAGHHP
jgi:hypothetical protein